MRIAVVSDIHGNLISLDREITAMGARRMPHARWVSAMLRGAGPLMP